MNLLLMGAMGFLWGLLHCMQIISHFFLVNITMPGNADFLFRLLVQIATLNIVPTEDITQNLESRFGIRNDEYVLTDSFTDFEFDSTGPVHNLQIMFLVMVILLILPILMLLILGLFFWSAKVRRGINAFK